MEAGVVVVVMLEDVARESEQFEPEQFFCDAFFGRLATWRKVEAGPFHATRSSDSFVASRETLVSE